MEAAAASAAAAEAGAAALPLEEGRRRRRRRRLDVIWARLKEWVVAEHGGYVHPGLSLANCSKKKDDDDGDGGDGDDAGDHRGIVATQHIAKGSLLVRLPAHLALGYKRPKRRQQQKQQQRLRSKDSSDVAGTGIDNDSNNNNNNNNNNAGPSSRAGATAAAAAGAPAPGPPPALGCGSPWLECLTELYRAQQHCQQQHCQQLQQNQQQQVQQHRDGSGVAAATASKATGATAHATTATAQWAPFLDSLPATYDTLLHWSDEHLQFLRGTSLSHDHHGDRRQQLQVLRQRYVSNVRPHLVERNLLSPQANQDDNSNSNRDEMDDIDNEAEFDRFLNACQAISTRCFHLDGGDEDEGGGGGVGVAAVMSGGDGTSTSVGGVGPCFLPVVDLLNHCSDEASKATTLTAVKHRDVEVDSQGKVGADDGTDEGIAYFEMRAERDVNAGEEITHSYFGQHNTMMTSEQCLRTFGFVERSATQRAANADSNHENGASSSNAATGMTPAVVSRDAVLQCCQRVVERERHGREVAQSVAAHSSPEGEQDAAETWDLPSPDEFAARDVLSSSLPEHLVVNASHPLSDELVTLLCLPFLPHDAYQELVLKEEEGPPASASVPQGAVISTLDDSVLDDPYLGQLVGRSILELVKDKADLYGEIRVGSLGVPGCDDRALLRELLRVEAFGQCSIDDNVEDDGVGWSSPTASQLRAMDATSRQRLAYALTVRLEEQACLDALRRRAIRVLLRATGSGDDDEYEVEDQDRGSRTGAEPPGAKRQRNSSA
jgi:SET domain